MGKCYKKMLIGFLTIIVLILVQLGVTHNVQKNILKSIRQMEKVETPLVSLMEQGTTYGIMASYQINHSILHVQKKDYKLIGEHKAAYHAINSKLEDIFNRDSKLLIGQSIINQEVKEIITAKLEEIDRINNLMVGLANKSFTAMDKKEDNLAYSLMMDGDYEGYQQEIRLIVKDLQDILNKEILDIENNISEKSQQIIYFNLGISVGIMVLIILTMLTLISFIKDKEKELDLRGKTELGYKKLFDNTADAIFIADVETRQLIDCNKSAEKLIGRSKKEIISMKADDLHPKDMVKSAMEGFRKQIEEKTKFLDTWVLTKDKRRISVRVIASIILLNGKMANQGIFLRREEIEDKIY